MVVQPKGLHGGNPEECWRDLEIELPKVAEVLPAKLDEEDLVVWRTLSGEVCVMEARCPHQWSNLGLEGVVDGEDLVCLAHFWRFSTTGEGWKANANGRRDRKGDVKVRSYRELNGRLQIQTEPSKEYETNE